MRVAITGATGFTGGHTVRELLAAGHDPVALIRDEKKLEQVRKLHNLPKFDFVVGDITDTASIQKLIHNCDAIIHTAAIAATGKKSIPLIKATNALGTKLILELSVQAKLDPIIYVSSQSVLHPPPDGKYTNSCPISPNLLKLVFVMSFCCTLIHEFGLHLRNEICLLFTHGLSECISLTFRKSC